MQITDQRNPCEFADGPLQGSLDLALPIEDAPLVIAFPVMEDLKPYKGSGVPSGIVEYEKRQHDGKWKYFHLKTDLSPEAAHAIHGQVENAKVHDRLSAFTNDQLIHELASRTGFVGVIVYALEELTGEVVPAGTDIGIVYSKFFNAPHNAARLLQIGVDTINRDGDIAGKTKRKKRDGPRAIEVDGMTTLPLYVIMAISLEPIAQFDKGKVRFEYVDPSYEPMQYQLESVGGLVGSDPNFAITAVKQWPDHLHKFKYFVQFRDDASRKLVRALYDHTETVTTLCDTRLGLDPTEIWDTFDSVLTFEGIHSDYRADANRAERYTDTEYASRLEDSHDRHAQHVMRAMRLISRIRKQIELKSSNWREMASLVASQEIAHVAIPDLNMSIDRLQSPSPLKLFYSYSHHDEELREELEKHLSALQRNGVIEGWHFRKIAAGREWEGEIDQNLEAAQIILLLLSADFLFSDYCWEVEGRRALERHQKSECKVIPVILRACDWGETPFHKLQGLPKGGLAVTSWENRDEAFTDIAKGIKNVAKSMRPTPMRQE